MIENLLRHCEEQSDEAISKSFTFEIAALPLVARNDNSEARRK
jgi:hypothetical protein